METTSGRRVAGQHARAQAQGVATRMLVVVGVSFVILLAARPVLGLRGPALVEAELGALVAMVAADRALGPEFGRWRRGARGEETVGAVLEGLKAQGWTGIHDISLGRGNVDHVAVGPGGVFAIETKSHRGRIRIDRIEPWMLKQAYAERKVVEEVTAMNVEALLVFSDAYLVGRVPARREGVIVLPARMLAGYLERRRPVMSVEVAREVAGRLTVAVGQGAGEAGP